MILFKINSFDFQVFSARESNLTLRFSGERNHSTFASPFNKSRAQPSPLQALVELSAARS
jgi:hypothetical protein